MSLKVEVISIGDEILTGFTINTNASVIGQSLLGIGIRVSSQRTVGDNKESLQQGLRDSIAHNDLIICTGGLGPTCDDLTRQYIAEVFDCELKHVPEIESYLRQTYSKRPAAIENQSLIPSKAQYILNEIGTASALIFEQNNTMIIFLPGVPAELKHFMHKDITPMLIHKFPNAACEFRQQCYFMQLSESQIDPTLRHLLEKYSHVEFGIYPNLGLISVHIISKFPSVEANLSYQEPIKLELINSFHDNFYSDTHKDISKIICNTCTEHNLTISLDENSPYLNLRSLLGPVLSTANGNIYVELSGVPTLIAEEEIYTAAIRVRVYLNGLKQSDTTHNMRGNKEMFITRCVHNTLCEIFKILRDLSYLENQPSTNTKKE